MATRIRTLHEYINKWQELDKHKDKSKEFQEGYKEACRDIMQKITNTKIIIQTSGYGIKIEEQTEDKDGK